MINVHPNPNFANWYNIVRNGKIIDNARNYAKGRRPSYKKAVVKLAEGDHIELYEAG